MNKILHRNYDNQLRGFLKKDMNQVAPTTKFFFFFERNDVVKREGKKRAESSRTCDDVVNRDEYDPDKDSNEAHQYKSDGRTEHDLCEFCTHSQQIAQIVNPKKFNSNIIYKKLKKDHLIDSIIIRISIITKKDLKRRSPARATGILHFLKLYKGDYMTP